MEVLLMVLLLVTAVFLILVVLVQRGRGGGLAGAFGGMGGQSAFGTKAGDLFTRITIVTAAFWILLCAVSVKLLATDQNQLMRDLGTSGTTETTKGSKAGAGRNATGPSKVPVGKTTKSSPASRAATSPPPAPPAKTNSK